MSSSHKPVYIVEHLEEGYKEGPWCVLEYQHIIDVVHGKKVYKLKETDPDFKSNENNQENTNEEPRVIITNISDEDASKLNGTFQHYNQSIREMWSKLSTDINDICFLDMRATEPLTTADAQKFKYFIYGGILGDHPPKDRSVNIRACGFPLRHLQDRQMTTDTAVHVSKRILEYGNKYDDLSYVDDPELYTGEKDTTSLPFRYIQAPNNTPKIKSCSKGGGFPLLPPGLFDHLCSDLDIPLRLTKEDIDFALQEDMEELNEAVGDSKIDDDELFPASDDDDAEVFEGEEGEEGEDDEKLF